MAPALLVRQPPGYEPERRYVTEVMLSEFLGLEVSFQTEERADVAITPADAPASPALSLPDLFFGTPRADWLTKRSLPTPPLPRLNLAEAPFFSGPAAAELLPILYGAPFSSGRFVELDDTGIRFGVDVLGGAFMLLTRYEELAVQTRDEHGRFPAAASLGLRDGFLDRPLVNEYVELVWSALAALWPRLQRRQRRFVVRPSHDVDFPFVGAAREQALALALRELRRETAPVVAARRVVASLRRRSGSGSGRDLYQTFDFIMDLSEEQSLESAFYFIPRNTAGAIDGEYSLDDPRIRRLMRRIHERGHEIGFHPGYATVDDSESTRRDFDRLRLACAELGIEQERWGGRQHYLRWLNPTTWQNWEDAGLHYDSTLSFAERPGFRCGVCYEFPVFNLLTRKRLNLRERPLIVMDASLLSYARLTPERALDEIERLKERCRRMRGEFTLLWHNDRLLSRRVRRAYARAISSPGTFRAPAETSR